MWIARLFFISLVLVPSICTAFCFTEAGNDYGINSNLLQSIARTESNLNPRAVNKNQNGSTDVGLMQINSSWFSRMGLDAGRLLSDPCYNVKTGASILKLCLDKHGYTWEAVGCYNAVSKPKRVDYSWKVFNMLKEESKRQKTELYPPTHPSPSRAMARRGEGKGGGENSKPRNPNSSLSFSMRDNAAIE